MKKIISIAVLMFTLCALNIVKAQNYQTGVGIRFGAVSSGISFRQFINPEGAIEGIAGFGHRSFILTGLYERFIPINNANGLSWFYGGGGHIAFFRDGGYYYIYKEKGHFYYLSDDEASTAVFGADFIFGLDYKFNNAPLNIGFDIKPFIDFHDGIYGYFDGAFNFRFVF